jgi:TetR/AcrR family transcriptional regulator, regulator of cefoperazone and chloramphenicol sensitivity
MSKRGTETRDRLIDAALILFGKRGYDGVGAREITTAAGVPLAALPYHFGTKAELYRKTLERVQQKLEASIAPHVPAVLASLNGSPKDAEKALGVFKGELLHIIAVAEESDIWSQLLIREHMDPSEAFDVVYEDIGKNAVELIAALVAHANGRDLSDEDVLIDAFRHVGEVLVFRTVQKAIVTRMGWEGLDTTKAEQIRTRFAASPT